MAYDYELLSKMPDNQLTIKNLFLQYMDVEASRSQTRKTVITKQTSQPLHQTHVQINF